jgi:hypothetical protein
MHTQVKMRCAGVGLSSTSEVSDRVIGLKGGLSSKLRYVIYGFRDTKRSKNFSCSGALLVMWLCC